MAYSKALAKDVEAILEKMALPNLISKKMFGGVGYLINGNMACGVLGERFIARIGKDTYEEALVQPETSPFNTTGRAMLGWVFVDPSVDREHANLETWVHRSIQFTLTLPPK